MNNLENTAKQNPKALKDPINQWFYDYDDWFHEKNDFQKSFILAEKKWDKIETGIIGSL